MRSAAAWAAVTVVGLVVLGACTAVDPDAQSGTETTACKNSRVPESQRREPTPPRETPDTDLVSGNFTIASVIHTANAHRAVAGVDYVVQYEEYHESQWKFTSLDVSSLSEDCRLVGAQVDYTAGSLAEYRETLGIFDGSSFATISTLGDDAGGPRQSISHGWQGQQLVWLETSSMNLDWTDWSIRRTTAQSDIESLGDSQDYFDTDTPPPIVGGYSQISVGTSSVTWNTADPATREPVLLSSSGDGIREIARGVWLHASSGEAIYYVDPMSETRATVVEVLPSGTSTTRLSLKIPPGRRITSLAVDGEKLAFVLSASIRDNVSARDAQVYVVDMKTMEATVIVTEGQLAGGRNLDVSGDTVAFGEGSGMGDPGEFLFFAGEGALYRMASAPGLGGVSVEGQVAAWNVIDDTDTPGVVVAKLAG